MSFQRWKSGNLLRFLIAGACAATLAFVVLGSGRLTAAQGPKKAVAAQSASNAEMVARGKYIVEDVAMCGTCHTPRRPDGELDHSRWLAGAAVPYLPAQPRPDWPLVAPRLAGLPPATNAGMITLLTTAIWTNGKPLRDPMPKFHMNSSDAASVVAYLRSL